MPCALSYPTLEFLQASTHSIAITHAIVSPFCLTSYWDFSESCSHSDKQNGRTATAGRGSVAGYLDPLQGIHLGNSKHVTPLQHVTASAQDDIETLGGEKETFFYQCFHVPENKIIPVLGYIESMCFLLWNQGTVAKNSFSFFLPYKSDW